MCIDMAAEKLLLKLLRVVVVEAEILYIVG
jgi:hypothetical protein